MEKKVLSIKTTQPIIDKLKDICDKERRSQAKTIEILIEEKYERLNHKETSKAE